MNSNRPVYSVSDLNNQRPAVYQPPGDQAELVQFKVGQIQATLNSLSASLPVQVHFDTGLLTRLLADHLRKNPEAIDPYNTQIRVNHANGELQIKHFDLTIHSIQQNQGIKKQSAWRHGPDGKLYKSIHYSNGVCDTGVWKEEQLDDSDECASNHLVYGRRSWPNGTREIGRFNYIPQIQQSGLVEGEIKNSRGEVVHQGRWAFNPESGHMETDRSEPAFAKSSSKPASLLSAILNNDFKSPQDAVNFLQACHHELVHDSALAKLSYSIAHQQLHNLPHPSLLKNSLDKIGGNTPGVKPYVARILLKHIANAIGQNMPLPVEHINNLTQNALVLLRTLNTSNQPNTIKTDTNLNQSQLHKLLTLLMKWRDTTDIGQDPELGDQVQRYTTHLGQKLAEMLRVIFTPEAFRTMPAEYRDDFDIAMKAVQLDGWLLQFTSDALRNNRDIVCTAVQRHGDALAFANPALLDDREIVIKAVAASGNSLRMVSSTLRNDHEVVLAAVQEPAGFALKHASAAMRNNREIVISAVRARGQSLEFANVRLRGDREVVLHAVTKWGCALRVANPALRNDRQVVMAAVRNNGLALRYASANLQNDRELVLAAIQNKGRAFQFASEALRNDPDIIRAAIRKWPPAIRFAGAQLQNMQL